MRINPASVTSYTYGFKMPTFQRVPPESFILFVQNFFKKPHRHRNKFPSGWINYLNIFLCGEYLQEFNSLSLNNSEINKYYLFIQLSNGNACSQIRSMQCFRECTFCDNSSHKGTYQNWQKLIITSLSFSGVKTQ